MVDNDQLQSTFLKKVSEVLEYLNKRKFCAADIDPDLVKYIPLYTLKNNVDPLMLLDIWPFISTSTQEELKNLLPCLKHYNKKCDDYDCIDDIPVAIKNCMQCQLLENGTTISDNKKKNYKHNSNKRKRTTVVKEEGIRQ